MNSPASPGQTTTPSVNEVSQGLPPLPTGIPTYDRLGEQTKAHYTADQMHAYARAAIAVQPPAASQPAPAVPTEPVAIRYRFYFPDPGKAGYQRIGDWNEIGPWDELPKQAREVQIIYATARATRPAARQPAAIQLAAVQGKK